MLKPHLIENQLLKRWLAMVKDDDEIIIDTTNINREANANTWCFSPTDTEMQGINTASIENFILQIIELKRVALQKHTLLFYCWHSLQTRQLNFSCVSQSHGYLPFSCIIKETTGLREVIDQVVNGDWLNKDYLQSPCKSDHVNTPFVLPVFVANLP